MARHYTFYVSNRKFVLEFSNNIRNFTYLWKVASCSDRQCKGILPLETLHEILKETPESLSISAFQANCARIGRALYLRSLVMLFLSAWHPASRKLSKYHFNGRSWLSREVFLTLAAAGENFSNCESKWFKRIKHRRSCHLIARLSPIG